MKCALGVFVKSAEANRHTGRVQGRYGTSDAIAYTCSLGAFCVLAKEDVRFRDRRYQKVYDISAIAFAG
jgi:hypothetical protein